MPDPALLPGSTAGRIRCAAGPGTGKTYQLKQRVSKLLEKAPDKGHRIFAVTFTRQAAAQLKGDLTQIQGAEELVACTLHSHAFSVLGSDSAIAALGRHPRPLFDHELPAFLHDAAASQGSVAAAKERLHAFDSMWARLQTEEIGFPTNTADKEFNDFYVQWMVLHRAMAIGELISLAVRYLRNNPMAPAYDTFDHILVDEYQDLNRADQVLLQLLASKGRMMIVGDDDQSIYSFRFANPDGIRQWLDGQAPPKEDYQLVVCRRCDGRIVDAANLLIARNPNRLKGDLRPLAEKVNRGEISVLQWNTLENELDGLAEGIDRLLKAGKVPPDGRILVLVPRADFGSRLATKLNAMGRTDVRFHGKPNWAGLEMQRALSLLSLADNQDDAVALRVWVGLGSADYRRAAYAKVIHHCVQTGATPQQVLRDDSLCRVTLRIAAIRDRYEELEGALRPLLDMGRAQRLAELLPLDGPTATLGAALRDVEATADPDQTLSELLREYVTAQIATTKDARVNIMTPHASKGLEAHTVVVSGLVNGVLPSAPAPTSVADVARLQEERRLMYVIVTRARERLILSSFQKATRGENRDLRLNLVGNFYYVNTVASRFLEELGLPVKSWQRGTAWIETL